MLKLTRSNTIAANAVSAWLNDHSQHQCSSSLKVLFFPCDEHHVSYPWCCLCHWWQLCRRRCCSDLPHPHSHLLGGSWTLVEGWSWYLQTSVRGNSANIWPQQTNVEFRLTYIQSYFIWWSFRTSIRLEDSRLTKRLIASHLLTIIKVSFIVSNPSPKDCSCLLLIKSPLQGLEFYTFQSPMKHSFSVVIHTKDTNMHLCNCSTFP